MSERSSPASVQPAECGRQGNRELQESSDFHGGADHSIDPLATRVLDNQHHSATFARKLHRPHRPSTIEVGRARAGLRGCHLSKEKFGHLRRMKGEIDSARSFAAASERDRT